MSERAALDRLEAAEAVCWHLILYMALGCTADQILDSVDALQTWANLACRDGLLSEDDPEGNEVTHAVPWPNGPVLPGYER